MYATNFSMTSSVSKVIAILWTVTNCRFRRCSSEGVMLRTDRYLRGHSERRRNLLQCVQGADRTCVGSTIYERDSKEGRRR